MHHYGGRIRTRIDPREFTIELENQESGAVVKVTGPVRGVFEDSQQMMDQDAIHHLAREIAKTLRKTTGRMGGGY